MTREATPQPIEAVPALPCAGGLVLRGVVVGRDPRALTRPRAASPALALPRAADKPIVAAAQPAVAQLNAVDNPEQRARAEAQRETTAQYQERGRGFQAGYEEGRHQGHAEGRQLGEEQGRKEGGQAGFEQGRLAARKAVEEEHATASGHVAERLRRLDLLLAALPAGIDRRLELAEEDMLGLCFEAVGCIVGDTAASPEGVHAIVRRAVLEAKFKQSATIRVNPRDLACLQADPDLAAWLGSSRRVQWLADERIELGGCLIAAPEGGLDARLETQMARLATLFAKARKDCGQ